MAVSAVLKNRGSHGGAGTRRRGSCSNGSPLPFWEETANGKTQGRGGSPSGPKVQARTRRWLSSNSSRRAAKTQRRSFWQHPGCCLASLPLYMMPFCEYVGPPPFPERCEAV